MYPLIRPLLFCLGAESAHNLTLRGLSATGALMRAKKLDAPVDLFGLRFLNPVGLAAGLDKNGTVIDGMGKMGFGFLEIGTVTPRPQVGNPQPRLFRVRPAEAVINRMGFNNGGVEALVERAAKRTYEGPVGINIGKNKDTPNEQATEDYLTCLRAVWPVADYVTVNISSPNTPGLRDLQGEESLVQLLGALREERARLQDRSGTDRPMLLKIAPDLANDALPRVGEACLAAGIDGLIATNTTLARTGVEGLKHGDETGGLSGKPLRERATEVVALLAGAFGETLPVIGVGGISSGADAVEKIQAGARLVQIYTGLVYQGPRLIRDAVQEIEAAKTKTVG